VIRAALVVFRLACLAALYWFLYRVCACLVADAKASLTAARSEEEEGDG
jgi:hypothetical protein